MLKKSVSIFMVVVMLLSMSITAVVFADAVNKGNQLSFNENKYNTTFDFLEGESGFAGKLSADTIGGKIILTATDSGTVLPLGTYDGGAFPQYYFNHGFVTSTNPLASSFTFQANIYADGEAVVGIASHWNDFFRWDKDGKFYAIENDDVNYSNEYTVAERHVATLERGRWHTIALTICTDQVNAENTNDYMVHKLYIDGAYVCDVTRIFRKHKHEAMKIGAYAGSGAGVIAIDDVYAYAGEYDATNEVVAPVNANADLTIDSAAKTIVCSENAFADAASFNEAVKTAFDANYAILYDSNLTTPATDFAYGVVAINSKNEIGYDYYTVADKLPEPVVDVKMQIEENFDDSAIDTTKLTIQNCEGDYTVAYTGSLGNKSADDKALVLSPTDKDVKADNYNEPSINLKDQNGYTEDIVTIEADVYKNDTATTSYVYTKYWNLDKPTPGQSWLNIVTFSNYGQIHIDGEDKMPYKANRWYKIAATYDREKAGFDVYVNGQYVDFVGITNNHTAVANYFQVVSHYDLSEKQIPDSQLNSQIAIDNYRLYLTPYIAADDNATITVGGNLKLSANTIIAENYTNLTAKQVMDAVTAPVECIIYADDTYTTELGDNDKITANSVLVSKSRSGEVTEYYNFSSGDIGYISFEAKDGDITASVYSTVADTDGYIFAIAEYNESNELLNVFVSENLDFAQTNNITIDYTEANTYKAFVWTANHVPVRYADFSEQSDA